MMDVPDGPAVEEKKGGRNFLKFGAIGCGGLIVLCILFSVGAYLYTERQKTQLIDAAAENRASGNYEEAINNLNQLIDEFPDSEEAADARATIPEVELEWGVALNESGDYTAAQEKLQSLMATESGPVADNARANLAFSYVGLAEQAITNGDVPGAYANYLNVFDEYGSGDGRQAALDSFAANFVGPLFEFAQSKENDGVYSDAALGYSAIAEYAPDSVEAAQARALIANAYYSWGVQLADEGSFDEAIEKLEIVVNEYPNSEAAVAAAESLIDTRVAAVAASGEAGALPAPLAAGGGEGGDTATYDVENDTICPILLLASGPDSQALKIPAGTSIQSEFVPGTYNVVVQTDDDEELSDYCQDIIPFTGEYAFEGGYIYESSFYIESE